MAVIIDKNIRTPQIFWTFDLNFKRPFFYEIPDANNIIRYYKILYNADFTEITPNENAPNITQADFDELLDNFDNVKLWKEKFPPNSYTFRGFVISNMFSFPKMTPALWHLKTQPQTSQDQNKVHD